MVHDYAALPLHPDEADRAFPLARALDRSLDPGRWRAFARAVALAGAREPVGAAGIMAVRGARGYLVGMFTHHVAPTPRFGPTLAVEHLLLVDPLVHAGAGPVLATGMADLARRHGCRAIQVTLVEGPPAAAVTTLKDALGPASEAHGLVRLWWRLDVSPAPGFRRRGAPGSLGGR